MAENNGTPAAQTEGANASAAAQTGNQQFNVPQGYRLVTNDDHTRFTSYENQVKGFKPLYDRLAKSGIKSEKDWDSFEPIVKTARDRKIDGKAFSSMFSTEADADLNGGQTNQPQQIDLAKLREEMKAETATELHSILYSREREGDAKALENALGKMLGEGEHDAYTKELAKQAVSNYLWEIRGSYPEGHPLAGKVMPLTQDMAEKAVAHFTALKAQNAGKDLAEKAKQAAEGASRPSGTVGGGGNSGTGKPNTQPQTRAERQRAELEKHYEQIKASRVSR